MPAPAPRSTRTLCPAATYSRTAEGVSPTRYSCTLISLGTPTRIESSACASIYQRSHVGFRQKPRWFDSFALYYCADRRYGAGIMRTLDRSDILLLREVTSNARCSHVELAERVGLSSTACARRLAALEEEGLIEGYQAVLGLKALGLGTTVIVRITLESQSEDALETFERAVVKCPSVVRCLLMSGSDDYLV